MFILLFAMIMVGCSSKNVDNKPEEQKETSDNQNKGEKADTTIDVSQITEFQQSPMLDDMDLPPVEDRIPKEPKLPNEMPSELLEFEIGKYGGTLNTVSQSINWDPNLFVMSNEPLINTPGISW